MKLIADKKDLQREFIRLIGEYDEFYWTTAWASSSHSAYDYLITNRKKIKQLLVGTHFYQTDPQFIKEFIDSQNVRFIWLADGTFHPKQYLFQKGNKWEMIVGSANFTRGAFKSNTETAIIISQNDNGAETLKTQFIELLDNLWPTGKTFTDSDYFKYLERFNHMKKYRVNLADGVDPNNPTTLSITQNPFLNKNWDDYYNEIQSVDKWFDERIRLMSIVREFFSASSFADMTTEQRFIISGIAKPEWNDESFNSYLFGHIRWPRFNQIVKNEFRIVSDALDCIPLTGDVKKEDYLEFMTIYRTIDEGNGLASPTRLLAMKRPDVFFCLTNTNEEKLYEVMKISELNENDYWDVLINQIKNCYWYYSPAPKDQKQLVVWNARVAFMDCLFYDNDKNIKE